jgi:hypothetical protein
MIAWYVAVVAFVFAGLLIWDWIMLTLQLELFKKDYPWPALLILGIDWVVISIVIWRLIVWIW